MQSAPTLAIALLPLDVEIVRTRLDSEDFCLVRNVAGEQTSVHFLPEFPGDALVLYDRFLDIAGEGGIVEGTFVIVHRVSVEAIGQVGTMGPPAANEVEIGYGVNPSATERGVATAAVRALLEILGALPERRIYARTAITNPASGRVLAKNGFAVVDQAPSDEVVLLTWER